MEDPFLNSSFFRPDFLITDNAVCLELNGQCDIQVECGEKENKYTLQFSPKFYSESYLQIIKDKFYYFLRPYINKDVVSPKLVTVEMKDKPPIRGYINRVTMRTNTDNGTLILEFSILL